MQPTSPELEPSQGKLPLISQETRDTLLDEMGAQQSGLEFTTHTREGFESWQKTQDRVRNLVMATVVDMADANPNLVQAIRDVVAINATLGTMDLDEYASGMAIVVKAFHIQSDFKLINDLSRLSSSDIQELTQDMGPKIKSLKNGNVFDIALKSPRIPAEQSFLREVTEVPPKINNGLFGNEYRTGAGLMYQAMEKIWQKLYPGDVSTPSSAPNPPTQPSV